MRIFKGSFVGLVLTGILLLAPTVAFARGGGGGGHFGGGGGHFGGGAHFAGFAGHGFAGHNFGGFAGAGFARRGDHFRHGGRFFFGGPNWDYYPYYGDDYPYYGYYDDNYGDYVYGQASPAEVAPSQETVIAVQRELTQLGYYHGRVDGLIGPETEGAIRWFQSVDKLPVTGQINEPTLEALRIS
jgi:hypothetical protein